MKTEAEPPLALPIARPTPIVLEPDALPRAKPVVDSVEIPVIPEVDSPHPSFADLPPHRQILHILKSIASGIEYAFGMVCIMFGLAILAAIPVLQFLTLGYLLECGGRVARTGRFRNSLVGVRLFAHLGGIVLACWVLLIPVRLIADLAHSASIIDPGGRIAQQWRIGSLLATALTALHILMAVANGGKLRHFLFPFNFVFVAMKLLRGGFYQRCRDAVWEALVSLCLPYYFTLGLRGFAVAVAWLILPVSLLAASRLKVAFAPVWGFYGAFLLTLVLIYLPFLQLKMVQTGRMIDGFDISAVRHDYRRAPWLMSFAFFITLLFALPLYLLKIEVVPKDAAWLPSLIFVAFIYPSRVLTGWALARAKSREHPRHWFFRWTGRIVFLPASAAYVLIVFFTQYTSWHGVWSLYEQHAFLLPVPFLSL
jgi:hypothetical protein